MADTNRHAEEDVGSPLPVVSPRTLEARKKRVIEFAAAVSAAPGGRAPPAAAAALPAAAAPGPMGVDSPRVLLRYEEARVKKASPRRRTVVDDSLPLAPCVIAGGFSGDVDDDEDDASDGAGMGLHDDDGDVEEVPCGSDAEDGVDCEENMDFEISDSDDDGGDSPGGRSTAPHSPSRAGDDNAARLIEFYQEAAVVNGVKDIDFDVDDDDRKDVFVPKFHQPMTYEEILNGGRRAPRDGGPESPAAPPPQAASYWTSPSSFGGGESRPGGPRPAAASFIDLFAAAALAPARSMPPPTDEPADFAVDASAPAPGGNTAPYDPRNPTRPPPGAAAGEAPTDEAFATAAAVAWSSSSWF